MCPDDATLSAYYDEELDAATTASVSAHVAGCDRCQGVVSSFALLSGSLQVPSLPVGRSSVIESKRHVAARAILLGPTTLWGRSLSVPLPIAAAAAIILIFAGLLLNIGRRSTTSARVDSGGSVLDSIVQYLDARTPASPVVFNLPESATFRVVSEPVFVRAAEYRQEGE